MKTLVDMLHILLCKTPHDYDIMHFDERVRGHCYYYLEHDVADCESLPDHIKWSDISEQFKSHLDLTSDEEALSFIKKSLSISKDLRDLVGTNRDRMDFIRGLLT